MLGYCSQWRSHRFSIFLVTLTFSNEYLSVGGWIWLAIRFISHSTSSNAYSRWSLGGAALSVLAFLVGFSRPIKTRHQLCPWSWRRNRASLNFSIRCEDSRQPGSQGPFQLDKSCSWNPWVSNWGGLLHQLFHDATQLALCRPLPVHAPSMYHVWSITRQLLGTISP
jgi:hypothetical protein